MSTIKDRMNDYIEISVLKEYLDVNYEDEMFYKNPKEYRGVIPEQDYKWFLHLGEKGGFMNNFFFSAYENYADLLDFEKARTAEMIGFLKNEGANR